MIPTFKKFLGAFLFLIGTFLLISSQSGITGNVVSERADAVGSVLSLVLIIGGLVLLQEGRLEKTVRQEKTAQELRNVLESGKMETYSRLARDAERAGYIIKESKNHMKIFYHDGKTTLLGKSGHPVMIPRHNEKKGTYRGILTELVNHDPYRHAA